MTTVQRIADAKEESHRQQILPMSSVLLAILCCILWGGNSVAVKFALESFSPLVMAGLRFALAALAIATWCRLNRAPLGVTVEQVPIILANGVLLFLQIATFTVGTAWSTSIHSIILVNAYPFFTALTTHFWIPEYSLTRRQLVGLIVAFAGVVMLFAEQLTLPDRNVMLGDLLLTASAAILGVKFTYVKTLLPRITVPRIVFWEAVTAVPMFFAVAYFWESYPRSLTVGATAGIAYQALAVSGVAFMVWTKLLAHHSPNTLAAISFTTPLFGMAVGYLALGEPITLSLLIGGLMIIAGIYRINSR
jgi:drug/metabolite transporter (DMT)-like permease